MWPCQLLCGAGGWGGRGDGYRNMDTDSEMTLTSSIGHCDCGEHCGRKLALELTSPAHQQSLRRDCSAGPDSLRTGSEGTHTSPSDFHTAPWNLKCEFECEVSPSPRACPSHGMKRLLFRRPRRPPRPLRCFVSLNFLARRSQPRKRGRNGTTPRNPDRRVISLSPPPAPPNPPPAPPASHRAALLAR